jgi:hypothetical protein
MLLRLGGKDEAGKDGFITGVDLFGKDYVLLERLWTMDEHGWQIVEYDQAHATAVPTKAPTAPTASPSNAPSAAPTAAPTAAHTAALTAPSAAPSTSSPPALDDPTSAGETLHTKTLALALAAFCLAA